MKWWIYLILGFVVVILIAFRLGRFRNKVISAKENIENAKSRVRILKAKYLQVLRKVGATQKESNASQGEAYSIANENGSGSFIGGVIGSIDSSFEEVGKLVVSLANELQTAQQNLNDLVNKYNLYITAFPRVILTKIFRYKKENYVDSDNLAASTRLSGFDEMDI